MTSDLSHTAAADVPTQVGKVSFVFQRGGSLQYTDAADVDTERKAYWNQVLKLVRGPPFGRLSRQYSLGARLQTDAATDGDHIQSVKQDDAKGVHPEGSGSEVQ